MARGQKWGKELEIELNFLILSYKLRMSVAIEKGTRWVCNKGFERLYIIRIIFNLKLN